MAKTPLGKKLEKYLQEKLKGIYELEANIAIGEYEGTLSMEDIEKLRKKLNNSTKTIEEMEKQLESHEKVVNVSLDAVKLQEGFALAPIVTPAGPALSPAAPLLLREKSKEISDDLVEVIKEQGKNSVKMALDGLKNARDILNNIGKK